MKVRKQYDQLGAAEVFLFVKFATAAVNQLVALLPHAKQFNSNQQEFDGQRST